MSTSRQSPAGRARVWLIALNTIVSALGVFAGWMALFGGLDPTAKWAAIIGLLGLLALQAKIVRKLGWVSSARARSVADSSKSTKE